MQFRWLILLLMFPLAALAQSGTITGHVLRAENKSPVGQANVFLSNTTFGTATDNDGAFTLSGLKPGQYTLVVSMVGMQQYTQTLQVSNAPIQLNIELVAKINELRDVIITTPANWKKNYAEFVKEFIGTDDNAKYCYVENPHDVSVIYHGAKQELEAYTDKFLVVDNQALGYKVKFLVSEFTSSKLTHIISYSGQRLFEEMKGSQKQEKEWHDKREAAYYGSSMHFYRALYADKLAQEGFQLMKLTRLPNPHRAQEAEIQQKLKHFNNGNRDSLNYWVDQENLSRYFREHLYRDPLQVNKVLYNTNTPGIYAVYFTDCLYVVYTKKHEDVDFKDVYRPLDMENFETTIITTNKVYYFDLNGVVFGENAPLYEGTWSKSKLSDLLPVDYAPDKVAE